MSKLNKAVPLILATGIGVYNGMYAFEPAFREQQEQREKTFEKQHTPEPGASQNSTKVEPDANIKLESSESAAPATAQKVVVSKDASGSISWFKSWGLAWPGSKANNEAEQPKSDAPKPLRQPSSTTSPQENSD